MTVPDNGDGDWTVTEQTLVTLDLHQRSGHSPVCIVDGRRWPCPIAAVREAYRDLINSEVVPS